LILQTDFSIIEQIKASMPIEQAAWHYLGLKLTRRGNRWLVCCPFHQEKTASFIIFPDGGYKCFGCQEHGDIIDLVAKGLHIDTAAAIKLLAADLGLQNDNRRGNQSTRRQISAQIRQIRLKQATDLAADDDILRVFLELAAIVRALNQLLKTQTDYEAHPLAVHWRPILDDILDDMESPQKDIQVNGWRRARRLLPWIK
jgi:DNA primase